MKISSSLKTLKVRKENLQVVKRGRRIYVVIKKVKGIKSFDNRFKVRQGR